MNDKKKQRRLEQNSRTTNVKRKKERIQRIKRLTRVRRRLWLQISPPTKGYRDLRRRLYLPRSPSVWTCIHLLRSPSLWWERFLGFLVFVVFVLMMMTERERNYSFLSSCWLNHHPKKEWMYSSSRKKRWKRRTRCVLPRRLWKMMPRAWTSFVLVLFKEVFCVTFATSAYFCFFCLHAFKDDISTFVRLRLWFSLWHLWRNCVCCSFLCALKINFEEEQKRKQKERTRTSNVTKLSHIHSFTN